MTDSLFSAIDRCNELLRLDFSAEEFAKLAEERSLSAESIEAVSSVFEYLRDKKEQSTIQMLLRTSRLPQKQVKTFDNFDFDVLKGKDTPDAGSHLRAQEHRVHRAAGDGQDASCAGVRLRVLPPPHEDVLHQGGRAA